MVWRLIGPQQGGHGDMIATDCLCDASNRWDVSGHMNLIGQRSKGNAACHCANNQIFHSMISCFDCCSSPNCYVITCQYYRRRKCNRPRFKPTTTVNV